MNSVSTVQAPQPANSFIAAAGKIGSLLGKKVVELAGPKLITELSVKAAIAAVGNSTLGGAVGGIVAGGLSPLITPFAAYGIGLGVSMGVTALGNLIYDVVVKDEEKQAPLPAQNHPGVLEAVVPGLVTNILVKGVQAIPGAKVFAPFAAPVIGHVVGEVSKLAKEIFANKAAAAA